MSAPKTTPAAAPSEVVDFRKMNRPPTHPGEMFEEEWRKPSGISQAEAARRMNMSMNRLNEIVKGKRGVTAKTAVLMGELTDTNPRLWLHLQADHDLWHAMHAAIGKVSAGSLTLAPPVKAQKKVRKTARRAGTRRKAT